MTVALASSTGGHLTELVKLRPRFEGVDDVVWVTFDSPQSRSLLAGEDVVFVRYSGPRQVLPVAANGLAARRLLKSRGITAVISNGASIALSYMVPARALRLPCVYIECAARSSGPSLTARLLRWVPGVRFYSQYPSQAVGGWGFAGSVLDGYVARPGATAPGPLRVVVTVGSQRAFGFRRLIERLVEILPPSAQVTWQTGPTDVGDLGIEARAFMPEDELRAEIESADVVVSHAGIGSALMALDAGQMAIVVPRLERYREHVDDHQRQIAAELEGRGLGIGCEVEALEPAMFDRAAATRIESVAGPAISLPLDGR